MARNTITLTMALLEQEVRAICQKNKVPPRYARNITQLAMVGTITAECQRVETDKRFASALADVFNSLTTPLLPLLDVEEQYYANHRRS